MTDLILYVDWVCLFGLVDLASLVVRNKKPRRWLRKDTFREALSKYLLFYFLGWAQVISSKSHGLGFK